MSANQKSLIALVIDGLFSLLVGLAWGNILHALGEPLVECVKDGAGAFGACAVLGTAIIVLFPFKDDQAGQALPNANQSGTPAG
ncbi:hypothetical protein [Streptomyces sp. DSM 118148]|uniref:hypothetical protein n=1 Tax=Streptomyces sp. DSM 118148 TaxID=3448667 RepID=UPI00403FD1C1